MQYLSDTQWPVYIIYKIYIQNILYNYLKFSFHAYESATFSSGSLNTRTYKKSEEKKLTSNWTLKYKVSNIDIYKFNRWPVQVDPFPSFVFT